MKCADKVSYKTRGEAWDFAKTVRRGYKRVPAYIYECGFCRKFHITHVRPERWRYNKIKHKKYNFNDVTQ